MPKIFDRCKFNVSGTPGTGNVTVGTRAATSMYLPSEAGAVAGDEIYYLILDGADEENGVGTMLTGATSFSRDTVSKSIISSVAGTSKLSLTASAIVALVAPAESFRALRGYRPVTTTSDAIQNGDGGGMVAYSNAAAINVTIAQAGASIAFLREWYVFVRNDGAGTLTLTPATSTINAATTLSLAQGQAAFIISDGSNYSAITFYDNPINQAIVMAIALG